MRFLNWIPSLIQINKKAYIILALSMLTGLLGLFLGLFGVQYFSHSALSAAMFNFEPISAFILCFYILIRARFIKPTLKLGTTSLLVAICFIVDFVFGGLLLSFSALYFLALCLFICIEFKAFKGTSRAFTSKLAGSLSLILIGFVLTNIFFVMLTSNEPLKTNVSLTQLLLTGVLIVCSSFNWPKSWKRIGACFLMLAPLSNMILTDIERSLKSGDFYIGSLLIFTTLVALIGTNYRDYKDATL